MTRWRSGLVIALVLGSASVPEHLYAQKAELPQAFQEAAQRLVRELATNQVVANAPYSADVVSTVTQVLADGTRIEQRASGKIYRDVAGRMRREQQVIGLGPLSTGTDPVTVVTITDPTTRTTYTINDQARTATKAPYSQVLRWNTPVQWNIPQGLGRGIVDLLNDPASSFGLAAVRLPRDQALANTDASLAIVTEGRIRLRQESTFPAAPALTPDAGQGARQGGGRGARGAGGAPTAAPPGTESLGSRQMEGVAADGTRVTQTIPAGQIGNDRPIVITDEVWESPELRVTVYSKHHDPRTGDVEYRLRNISRNEPPATLFQVPAGYNVVDPLSGIGNGAGRGVGNGVGNGLGRGAGGRGGVPAAGQ